MTDITILSEECETVDEILTILEATLRMLSDMAEDFDDEIRSSALEEARQKVESVGNWPY